MDTLPMTLDALPSGAAGVADYRIDASRDIAGMLQRLADGSVPVALHALDANGEATAVAEATVWCADAARGTLDLAVDGDDPALDAVLGAAEAIAVTRLDQVKLQFDLQRRVLVHGAQACVMHCAYPAELYRLQRRGTFRVKPLLRAAPVVRVRHSEIPEMQLALRVLDVSIGGCALFLPDDVPPLRPGVVMNQVEVELDADTRFRADMRLQHITSGAPDAAGVRLGCEFVKAGGDQLRALQRFIDHTQKRARLLGAR